MCEQFTHPGLAGVFFEFLDILPRLWNTYPVKDRINWIDVARGIGILLVMYGHVLTEHSYRYLIYSFHMPLFFFLSGIVFHVRTYEHFGHFFTKTAKNILIPYFIFAGISYLIWVIDGNLYSLSINGIFYQLGGILYGTGRDDGLFYNVVLWFLPCLFVAKIGFYLITKLTTNVKKIAGILFVSSLLGYAGYLYFPDLVLPFSFEVALTGIVFFGGGYLWSVQRDKIKVFVKRYSLPLFFLCVLLCIVFAQLNYDLYDKQIDLRINQLKNYFYFYLASFSGILATVFISIFINHNKFLEYLGKKSLILFGFHNIIFSFVTDFLLLFMPRQTIVDLKNVILAPFYLVTATSIILSIDILIGRIKKLYFHTKAKLFPSESLQ